MNLGFAGALAGGVITLLSPCSVMLLPAFFAYAFGSTTKLLARTGVFYLGLLATLVPLGVLAGGLGARIAEHRFGLVQIGAVLVILLGLFQIAGLRMPGLASRVDGEVTTTSAVFLYGTVYGLAGVCAGPVLGSVLTLAAMGGDPLYGGAVLAVFAVGMVVPLLLLALAWPRLPGVRRLVRPREIRVGPWRNTFTQLLGGVAGIVVGVVLLITDGTTSFGGILGASDQYEVETWALSRTDSIPDAAVVIAAALLLAGVWLVHRRSTTRARVGDAQQIERRRLLETNEAS